MRLRPKILTPLLLTGLILAACTYLLLDLQFERRVNNKIDQRAFEISAAISASSFGDDQGADRSAIVEALAADDAVDGVTLVDVRTERVQASSRGWTGLVVSDIPDESVAAQLRAALGATDRTSQAGGADVVVLPVYRGSPFDPESLSFDFAAISFDRGAVAADLEFARRQGAYLSVVAITVLTLVGYAVLSAFVVRPARRMTSSLAGGDEPVDPGTAGDSTADELALLGLTARHLVLAGRASEPARLEAASSIPDMRVHFDLDLRVLGGQVMMNEAESGGMSIDVATLDGLFSETVIEYVRDLVTTLDEGDEDWFEFSSGMQQYAVQVAAIDGGAFILEVRAIPDDTTGLPEAPQPDSSKVLRDILSELPVVVVETDRRGVVRFANRSPFDMRARNLVGHRFVEIVPRDAAGDAKAAMTAALEKRTPQSFIAERHDEDHVRRWVNEIAVIGSGESASILIASVEIPWTTSSLPPNPAATQQDDKLWEAELRVSDYESEIQQLRARFEQAEELAGRRDLEMLAMREEISAPLAALYRAGRSIEPADVPASVRPALQTLRSSLDALTGILEERLDLTVRDSALAGVDVAVERFHLPTLLDEIAIELGQSGNRHTPRIRVLVPPSLPKWVRGDVGALRASIGQMVEIARIVAFERPLVLTAAQEASKARSVQVRFSIQIPPPKLDGDALETLRACIGGSGKDDGALSGDFSDMVFGDARRPEKAPLELVAADDQAAVLRCSAEFEIAEEAESDQSWVRGLRTLIIQDAATVDNGIQPALGAFGIIGYVVTDEQDLIAALKIAEEYSNPYRLVLADVDTTDLEAFVSHLFDGDAPVVLVGTESESAMVGALSAGYDGYLAKPVRQVDLLEVILSTVEPPQHGSQARAADAA